MVVMTPEQAAIELGVAVDASEREVRAAYRRAARDVHPDRQAGASMREAALASATFVRVTDARDVLLARASRRAAAGASAGAAAASTGTLRAARPSTALLITWTALLGVGIGVSVLAHDFPLTPIEPAIRFSLLAVSAVSFALTGAKPWWVLLWVAIIGTAVETVLFTTLGSLLGMLALAAPIYGLSLIGWARRRMRDANAAVT